MLKDQNSLKLAPTSSQIESNLFILFLQSHQQNFEQFEKYIDLQLQNYNDVEFQAETSLF
jgi:hypothetical protein